MKRILIILLRLVTLIPLLPVILVGGLVFTMGAIVEFLWQNLIWLSKKFEESWVSDALYKYIDFFEKRLK